MAKSKSGVVRIDEGHIVVKNKKFKKSDILVFGVCLLLSLIIWVYAANLEIKEASKLDPSHNPGAVTETV